MTCDIIIPTYNNSAVLPAALAALFAQAIPGGCTVRLIVSDDGSTDNTLPCAARLDPPASWRPTCFVTGPHTGAAGARNRALAYSSADLIILLGADIVLRPGALAAHLQFHAARPSARDAALGLLKWDPRLRPTPLMEWMIHGGGQNDFDHLLGRTTADPRHFFYASHVSLKRAALGARRFPAVYRSYGWEDLDLGRTLAPHLTLHVLHAALGLHHHFYTPSDICRRQFAVGQNLHLYQQRYPNTPLFPRRPSLHKLKHYLLATSGLLSLLSWWTSIIADKWSTPRLFSRITALYFWQGVYNPGTLSPKV
ncbi:MAG: glycosyltransferase family 2 protein [Candidatus Andersenbacteria bacterium]|nr:glycosyltransferase family 2 protein [Candidatus Andersenbacteria bacterium]